VKEGGNHHQGFQQPQSNQVINNPPVKQNQPPPVQTPTQTYGNKKKLDP
jgi:hypothetical protein